MCVFLCGYYMFKTYFTNVNDTKQEYIYSVLFHHCYTHYSNPSLWFKLNTLLLLYLMVLTPMTSGKESSSSLLSFSSRKVIPVQFMATMNLLLGSGGPETH